MPRIIVEGANVIDEDVRLEALNNLNKLPTEVLKFLGDSAKNAKRINGLMKFKSTIISMYG